jgi:hypothetical protein
VTGVAVKDVPLHAGAVLGLEAAQGAGDVGLLPALVVQVPLQVAFRFVHLAAVVAKTGEYLTVRDRTVFALYRLTRHKLYKNLLFALLYYNVSYKKAFRELMTLAEVLVKVVQ